MLIFIVCGTSTTNFICKSEIIAEIAFCRKRHKWDILAYERGKKKMGRPY